MGKSGPVTANSIANVVRSSFWVQVAQEQFHGWLYDVVYRRLLRRTTSCAASSEARVQGWR